MIISPSFFFYHSLLSNKIKLFELSFPKNFLLNLKTTSSFELIVHLVLFVIIIVLYIPMLVNIFFSLFILFILIICQLSSSILLC